jgi:hypothetical protein
LTAFHIWKSMDVIRTSRDRTVPSSCDSKVNWRWNLYSSGKESRSSSEKGPEPIVQVLIEDGKCNDVISGQC